MSRAFVKEDGGEAWMPPLPGPPRAYRLVWRGPGGPEILRETDDLLDALRWLKLRGGPAFEVRDHTGALLATLTA